MTPPFDDSISRFLTSLDLDVTLPPGFEVLNPYSNPQVVQAVEKFCKRYYATSNSRLSIWGINPGRLGAGLTGLSFTDPEALKNDLGIDCIIDGRREASAEFVYKVISKLGGPELFYSRYYMSALCPLGFVRSGLNINFYDDKVFAEQLSVFILKTMRQQISFGLRTDRAVVLGTGKLRNYFEKHVQPHGLFDSVEFLEHPRFIMQYKRKDLSRYLDKYVNLLLK